jgi:hypothetical protein
MSKNPMGISLWHWSIAKHQSVSDDMLSSDAAFVTSVWKDTHGLPQQMPQATITRDPELLVDVTISSNVITNCTFTLLSHPI